MNQWKIQINSERTQFFASGPLRDPNTGMVAESR